MSNTLPTLKEFRRMLVVAKSNSTIAASLNGLRNAWLLCDTEYVSAHSELEDVKNELRKLEEKYKTLKDKHYRLENTIDKLDDEAISASREIKQTKYDSNKYDNYPEDDRDEFLDCFDDGDSFGK